MLTKLKVQGQFTTSEVHRYHEGFLVLFYPFRHVCSRYMIMVAKNFTPVCSHFIYSCFVYSHDNGHNNFTPISYDSVTECTSFCLSRSAWFSISSATISAWPCWLANISGDKSPWMEVSWMQNHNWYDDICSSIPSPLLDASHVYDMSSACSCGMYENGVSS